MTEPKAPSLAGLAPGRIVNYVRADGEARPMMIVKVFNADPEREIAPGLVSGQIFRDGPNDNAADGLGDKPLNWAACVPYSAAPMPHSWHWPPRA